MIWFFYNCFFPIVFLLLLPRFLLRMWKRGGYRKGFLQRFGCYEASVRECLRNRPRIWIHAVSVGEVQVALQGGGHRVGRREVPVRLDQLALRAVQDREDAEGEEHRPAAHDQGREDMGGIGRDARVDEGIPEQLEAPDQADGKQDAYPLRADEQPNVVLRIHLPTVPPWEGPNGRADRPMRRCASVHIRTRR